MRAVSVQEPPAGYRIDGRARNMSGMELARTIARIGIGLLAWLGACGSPEHERAEASSSAATLATADATGTSGTSEAGDITSTTQAGADTSTGAPETPAFSGPLTVMTFNVLCSFCDSSFDPWEERVPNIADTIERHAPDLVGLQELALPEEVDQLLAVNPDYTAIFYGIDDGSPYPDATIFYRTEMFEPVDYGFYWLSPTPDAPMSKGFADGFQLPRLVTWAVLRHTGDGGELLFASTHFDNNAPSQEKSAPLVLERTPSAADGRPIVFVGDFNSRPDSVAYATLTGADGFHFDDAFALAPEWSMDTNQTPAPAYDLGQRIDHVLLAGVAWDVERWVVDTWIYGANDLYVSDHFAITASLVAPE